MVVLVKSNKAFNLLFTGYSGKVAKVIGSCPEILDNCTFVQLAFFKSNANIA
jgi:hypothetical protein